VVTALVASTKLLYAAPGFSGILSWYVTSHSGQPSLLPSVGWQMSTG